VLVNAVINDSLTLSINGIKKFKPVSTSVEY
jgi:hypothetical protein